MITFGTACDDDIREVRVAFGFSENDTLVGTSETDFLFGGSGDDLIEGRGGADLLAGGSGADRITATGAGSLALGGSGDDRLFGFGDVTLRGEAGDDAMFGVGPAPYQRAHGGAGDDLIAGARDAFGGAGNDTLRDENLFGERLHGGSGDDVFENVGLAEIIGGSGFDTIDQSRSRNALTIDLSAGTGREETSAGFAPRAIRGVEAVLAGDGDDDLSGNGRANLLTGADGADTLAGRGGDDTLSGGAGENVLTGGAGADLFVIGAGTDIITDFREGDALATEHGALNLAAAMLTQTAEGVLIDLGTGTALLQGATVDDLLGG